MDVFAPHIWVQVICKFFTLALRMHGAVYLLAIECMSE